MAVKRPGLFVLTSTGQVVLGFDAHEFVAGETVPLATFAPGVNAAFVLGAQGEEHIILTHPDHPPLRMTLEYIEPTPH